MTHGWEDTHGETPWDIEVAYGTDLDDALREVQEAADEVERAVAELEAEEGYEW